MNEERLQFLVTLNDTLRPLKDPVQMQDVAVRLLREHLCVNRVAFAEVDGSEYVVVRSFIDGVAAAVARAPITAFGQALRDSCVRGETVVVEDVRSDPRFTESERTGLVANQIVAFVGAMLRKDGEWVASFGVDSATPRTWTRAEVALIEQTAERTWSAAERARAEESLRDSEGRHAFLLMLSDALRAVGDPSEVQRTAARLLGEHLQVNRVGYAEIEGREYVIRCEYTNDVPPLVGHGISGTFGAALSEAYRRGDTVVVNDVASDPRFTESERVTMEGRKIAAFVGVTLIKAGRMVAAFGANHATARRWTATEIALVRDVAERTWEAVERARVEAALRVREQRLQLALDASAAGVWTWDVRANRLDWDERVHAHYGFDPEHAPSLHTWIAALHDDDRQRVLDHLERVINAPHEHEWNETFRIVRADGGERWIHGIGRAERDADGRLTRLGGICLDVTDRRRTEEALQARRFEEHDRELRLLLETAAQGIVSVDAHGVIVTANRALETMFGWAPGALVGQTIEQLLPPAAREAHLHHRSIYFLAPRARSMGKGLDLLGKRKDGSTFPIEVSLSHVGTAGGGRAIAFVTDITERQQAAAALQGRTAALEYRTAQLSRMASELTLAEHHAREQLARTLHDGLQQLLLVAAVNLDHQLKRDVQLGVASGECVVQARNGLNEAIAAARSLSYELYPPVLQSSGLPAALTWLADQTHKKYALEVQVSVDPRADSTRKDMRTLLFESVRELLINAVKHAQVGCVAVDLALDADEAICITVTDQGIGFDPAALSDRAKSGHVGWGLISIRERLTLLGGRFEIHSAPGHGTVFRLVAPRGLAPEAVAVPRASAAAGSRPGREDTPPVSSAAVLRILIVDDHAAVRTVFRELLEEQREFAVVGDACNGLEAIDQARTLKPDVILMDISMPHMDGIEATRRIRAELESIEILGLSSQLWPEPVHPIQEAGASGYFVKGLDTQRLIDRLLRMHAGRAAAPAARSV